MRYVTHQFAHAETLDRTRRWLVQVGFDISRIEVHTHGTPRLAVAVEAGEAAEVDRLIDAAEASDPDGYPSFWELARHQPIDPPLKETGLAVEPQPHAASFVVAWRPVDNDREVLQTIADMHLLEAYVERGD